MSLISLVLPIEIGMRGKKFADDDGVIVAVKKWLLKADSNFYETGMKALVHRRRKFLKSHGKYVDKCWWACRKY